MTGVPTGTETPLDAMLDLAAASCLEYDVLADAAVVRADYRAACTNVMDIPVITRPDKNTCRMFGEMDKACHTNLWYVLAVLSIRRLGPLIVRLIASAIDSLVVIENTMIEDLTAIGGTDPKIVGSVVNWFAATREPGDWCGAILCAWQATDMGVDEAKTSLLSQTLAGRIVMTTGSLGGYSCDFTKEAIIERGGKVAGPMSEKADYIVIGANADLKATKAEELGIPILSETQFTQFLAAGTIQNSSLRRFINPL